MEQIAITVPYGVVPGQQMKATTPDGRAFMITVPSELSVYIRPPPNSLTTVDKRRAPPTVGARPGMTLMATVPPAAAPGAGKRGSGPPPVAESEPQIVEMGTTAAEGVDPKDLCSVCGAVCIMLSCYPKFPDCLGCASKGVFLCCEIEAVLCKTGRQDGSICMCMKSEVEVIKPTVCIKCTEQLFCLDLRCALPFDDEVPCLCAALGLTMMKDFKCLCSCGDKLGDKGEDKPEGAPPAAEQGEGGIECEKMTR